MHELIGWLVKKPITYSNGNDNIVSFRGRVSNADLALAV